MNSIGVNSPVIAHGANATMFDAFSDFTPAQLQQFRDQILGQTYRHFVNLVAQRRGLTPARVDQIVRDAFGPETRRSNSNWSTGWAVSRRQSRPPGNWPKSSEDTKLGQLELPTPPGLLSSLTKGKVGSGGRAWRRPFHAVARVALDVRRGRWGARRMAESGTVPGGAGDLRQQRRRPSPPRFHLIRERAIVTAVPAHTLSNSRAAQFTDPEKHRGGGS